MNTSLEKLDKDLFQPLEATESNMVLGGQKAFTFIGLTNYGGQVYNDYEVDDVIYV